MIFVNKAQSVVHATVSLIVWLFLINAGTTGAQELPLLSDMELPDAEHFLKGEPVDWVVLKDGTVVVTEPVVPRPDTLNKMQQAIDASLKWPRPTTADERKEQMEKRERLNYLNVVLKIEGEVQEYDLHRKHIEDVILHEDLMLRRIDKLIDEKQLLVANEMLFLMERRTPKWMGISRKRNKLLMAEANRLIEQENWDLALIRLEELYRRDKQADQLGEAMGRVHDYVIEQSIGKKDYRQVRFFLERLNQYFPEHPIGRKWSNQLISESKLLMDKAQQAFRNHDHKQAAEVARQADRIWPLSSTDSRDAYRQIQQRYQQIKVGVFDLATGKSGYVFDTFAKRRIRKLINLDLFAVDRLDDAPHYGSPLLEEWTPLDLGRTLEISLKPTYSAWESKPVIQAAEVADTINQRLQVGQPLYSERLDHYINHISVHSPFRFRIAFDEVPIRPEALLRFPTLSQQLNVTSKTESHQREWSLTKTRRFRLLEQSDSHAVYVRSKAQESGLAQYHLAEISEQLYPDDESAIRALRQEKIDMLAQLPSWAVAGMRKDNRFNINKYRVPVTHVIQFNPDTKSLRNSQLRRALIYALDRQTILNRFLLHDSEGKHGRLTTAPFTRSLGGYHQLITPRAVDPGLAFALAAAAKQQLGGPIPKLKLLCSPEALAQTGAERVIEAWARIQVDVELIEFNQAEIADWDLVYRTVRMEDPYLDLWPFLTFEDRARIASLKYFPDWLRQLLIELDQASDKGTAISLLQELHEKLWFEALYIPLWEVDEFYAINRNIGGALVEPMSTYQNIEQWNVKP